MADLKTGLFRVSCEESIHHRGTEFAEIGEFSSQTSLLCASALRGAISEFCFT